MARVSCIANSMLAHTITLPYHCIYCHVGRQAIPCACFDAMKHTLKNSIIFAWGFLLRIAREELLIVSGFSLCQSSVPHSPPTLISLYKLLYYFHITVEQGSYSKLCASFALPILIPCLGMHKCTHYSFLFLSSGPDIKWEGHLIWITWEHVAFLFPCLYFQLPIFMHCILTTSWMRNRKLLLLCLYLDAGVIPCGNSTCDLSPSNIWSPKRK